MNMTYRSKKQVTSLMARCSQGVAKVYPRCTQALAILMSKLRSSLGAAWEQPGSSLEYAYSYGSCPTRLRLVMSLLLILIVGSSSVWGQTNFSGTYFMAMPGTGSYDSETIENNYYLVPTEDWCYFVTPNSVQAEDNGQPFLTTYKCGHVKKAKWIIQKHTTENKYYIIHLADGKYLTYNVQLSGAGENRVRVHLEASITGDNNLFTITNSGDNYFISPETGQYLNVTDGNKNSYAGASGKNDGPTGYKDVSGIIGRWNQNNNTSQFRLEPTSSIDAPMVLLPYQQLRALLFIIPQTVTHQPHLHIQVQERLPLILTRQRV